MIKKQSLQGAGCWALGWVLGTCYTDKEEYLSVQPMVHLLGNSAAQGIIFCG